jgi:hypothetical protein
MQTNRSYLIGMGLLLGINALLFYYLQIATGYNAPTTVYAKLIISNSRLVDIPYNPAPQIWSWRSTLFWEQNYPLPALMEAIFSSILGLDPTYMFLMPLLASNVVFPFAWGKSLGWKNRFTMLYSIMLTTYFVTIATISRHTYGEYLLYAFLVPLFMLVGGKNRKSRELLGLILLFLLALSLSHQGFLGFATGGLVAVFIASVLPSIRRGRDPRRGVFSVACFFSVFLFLFVNPFIQYTNEWGYVPKSFGGLILQMETVLSAIWLHNILQVPYEGGSLLINPPRPAVYNWVSHFVVATNVILALGAIGIVALYLGRILLGRLERGYLPNRVLVSFLIVGTIAFDALSYSLIFVSIPTGVAAVVGPLLLPGDSYMKTRSDAVPASEHRKVTLSRVLTAAVLCSIAVSSAFMLTGVNIFGSGASYPFEAFATIPVSNFLANHGGQMAVMGTPDATSKAFIYLPLNKISNIDTVRYGTQVYLLSRAMGSNQSELNQVFNETGTNAWLLTRSEFNHVVWGEVAGFSVPSFSNATAASSDAKLNLVYCSSSVMLFILNNAQ